MRKPFFEVYERARDATCFWCYGDLDDFCRTEFSFGNGSWEGYCAACRRKTIFDVQEEEEE